MLKTLCQYVGGRIVQRLNNSNQTSAWDWGWVDKTLVWDTTSMISKCCAGLKMILCGSKHYHLNLDMTMFFFSSKSSTILKPSHQSMTLEESLLFYKANFCWAVRPQSHYHTIGNLILICTFLYIEPINYFVEISLFIDPFRPCEKIIELSLLAILLPVVMLSLYFV